MSECSSTSSVVVCFNCGSKNSKDTILRSFVEIFWPVSRSQRSPFLLPWPLAWRRERRPRRGLSRPSSQAPRRPILGGAPFQITGPTGAMSAVLVVIASRYGLEGVWLASIMAGLIIIVLGPVKIGQIINFIPSAVITGFTSGIAMIIFVGQIGNLLGVETVSRSPNAFAQLWGYIQLRRLPTLAPLLLSLLVIVTMIVWPQKLNARFPGSLLALILATVVTAVFRLDVPKIGTIRSRSSSTTGLSWGDIPWHHLGELIGPALSVAALGAIKSLLCGAVIGRQAGVKMNDNVQELFAQGVGNILVPFFGGMCPVAAPSPGGASSSEADGGDSIGRHLARVGPAPVGRFHSVR